MSGESKELFEVNWRLSSKSILLKKGSHLYHSSTAGELDDFDLRKSTFFGTTPFAVAVMAPPRSFGWYSEEEGMLRDYNPVYIFRVKKDIEIVVDSSAELKHQKGYTQEYTNSRLSSMFYNKAKYKTQEIFIKEPFKFLEVVRKDDGSLLHFKSYEFQSYYKLLQTIVNDKGDRYIDLFNRIVERRISDESRVNPESKAYDANLPDHFSRAFLSFEERREILKKISGTLRF